jgi:hypothetical protein
VKKITAAQAVAELDRTVGIQTKHNSPPGDRFYHRE